jgi:Ca2+-binding EF-hand superfamily protein
LQVETTMVNGFKASAGAALLALSATAYAQEPGSEARFRSLDDNGDGFVSRAEGKDAEELNTRFSELDVNNDGKLTRDEYAVLEREAREAAAKNTKEQQAKARRSSAAGGSR